MADIGIFICPKCGHKIHPDSTDCPWCCQKFDGAQNLLASAHAPDESGKPGPQRNVKPSPSHPTHDKQLGPGVVMQNPQRTLRQRMLFFALSLFLFALPIFGTWMAFFRSRGSDNGLEEVRFGGYAVNVPSTWKRFEADEMATLGRQFQAQSAEIYQRYNGGARPSSNMTDFNAYRSPDGTTFMGMVLVVPSEANPMDNLRREVQQKAKWGIEQGLIKQASDAKPVSRGEFNGFYVEMENAKGTHDFAGGLIASNRKEIAAIMLLEATGEDSPQSFNKLLASAHLVPDAENQGILNLISVAAVLLLTYFCWVGGGAALKEAVTRPAPSLHRAAETGDVSGITTFLGGSADKDARDRYGCTALHIAAFKNDLPTVSALLSAGADPNIGDKSGESPLHRKAGAGGATPLHIAVEYHNKDAAALLLANRANVNAKDKNGQTSLHFAVLYLGGGMLELLLNNKADVNAKDNEDQTPLHLAARNGCTDATEILLANGAEVNATDATFYELTPLHLAALNGYSRLAEVLLASGANVNARNKKGKTPLDYAVGRQHEALAQLLGSHGGKRA